MSQSEQRTKATLTTGAAVLAVAAAGYVGSASEVPTVRSPLPLATTLPVLWFWMGVHEAPALRWIIEHAIPALLGPLFLLAWYPRLFLGAWQVPKRSVAGLLMLSLLTVAHFVFGWKYGITYQGPRYTTALMFLNVGSLAAAWALFRFARKRQRFSATLVAHTFVVAWLVWIAFPWLGELP